MSKRDPQKRWVDLGFPIKQLDQGTPKNHTQILPHADVDNRTMGLRSRLEEDHPLSEVEVHGLCPRDRFESKRTHRHAFRGADYSAINVEPANLEWQSTPGQTELEWQLGRGNTPLPSPLLASCGQGGVLLSGPQSLVLTSQYFLSLSFASFFFLRNKCKRSLWER